MPAPTEPIDASSFSAGFGTAPRVPWVRPHELGAPTGTPTPGCRPACPPPAARLRASRVTAHRRTAPGPFGGELGIPTLFTLRISTSQATLESTGESIWSLPPPPPRRVDSPHGFGASRSPRRDWRDHERRASRAGAASAMARRPQLANVEAVEIPPVPAPHTPPFSPTRDCSLHPSNDSFSRSALAT